MKILYLHGLDSYLHDDRREILSMYGSIEAPILDYMNTPNLFEKLITDYKYVDVIIGSSAGGLVAYYLAQNIKKPCLLFNPALPHRTKMPSMIFNSEYNLFMQVILGMQDEVIPYQKSLQILQEDIGFKQNVEIHIISSMKHSYDIDIFKNGCEYFFRKLKN